jgi:hypothetical protein
MANRSLIHVRVAGPFGEKLIPVYLHWLAVDSPWMKKGEAQILQELCRCVVDNMDDIEKKAKAEGKFSFKRVGGSDLICAAYAVSLRDASSHCLIQLDCSQPDLRGNHLYNTTRYSLTIWVAPYGMDGYGVDGEEVGDSTDRGGASSRRLELWPIDCQIDRL